MKIEEGKFYRTRDGRKLGPYVLNFDDIMWIAGDFTTARYADTGRLNQDNEGPGDLVAEWSEGPVRTVTRKEIVPGTYGEIQISDDNRMMLDGVSLWLPRNKRWQADELRAAAATLTEIADALAQPKEEPR